MVIIGLIFIWIVGREAKSGFTPNDEHSDKIKGKAAIKTYYVGVALIIAELLWLQVGYEFLSLPRPDAEYLLIAAMMALGRYFGAFSFYYSREGKVQ